MIKKMDVSVVLAGFFSSRRNKISRIECVFYGGLNMTREELIEMVGTEEQADYVMEIILGQVKKDFVKSAIKSKLADTENRIKELETEGYIYTNNGTKKVDWNPNKDREKQNEANSLIYIRNRLISMLAYRQ